MGVYIPKMEMPRACYYCHFLFRDKRHNKVYCTVHHEFDKWLDISDAPAEGRADDCPLVELPPHGDLIDRDKLLERFAKEQKAADEHGRDFSFSFYSGNEVCTEWWAVEKFVDDAPTIIESEEEDGRT